MLEKLWQQQWIRYVVCLLVGAGIGVVFYPTKHIEERVTKKYEQEISSLKEIHFKELDQTKETYAKQTEESKTKIEEAEKKVSVLTTQIHDLQSKQKTSYYKLVKPDGTIEIKKFSETDVNESSKTITSIQEEFKQKVASIETKWETIHKKRLESIKKDFDSKEQSYKKTIEEMSKTKVTTVNEKHFGAEGGINTERRYYLHATGTLYGPLFLGVHADTDKEFDKKSIGLGVGINF